MDDNKDKREFKSLDSDQTHLSLAQLFNRFGTRKSIARMVPPTFEEIRYEKYYLSWIG